MRECSDIGHKSRRRDCTLHHQRATEYQHHRNGRDTQELAHRRCQLLLAGHREQDVRHLGIYSAELIADVTKCVVTLDGLNARQRLLHHAYHIAHTLLTLLCGVAQALYNLTDDEAHDGQIENREYGQLPRNLHHHHAVADDEEWLAECHLQGVGDAELHNHHVGCNLRHYIALALVAEVTHVHRHRALEHLVTHTLQRACTQRLDCHSTQVTEQVAKHI